MSWSVRRRAARLALSLVGIGLLASVARAQDATWLVNPGSNNFNTASNWSPATVPTGSAIFGASSVTTLTFSASTTVGDLTFNAGAPQYTFFLGALTLNGSGIVNNSSNRPSFGITPGDLFLRNGATAGNASISLLDSVNLFDTSSLGTASVQAIEVNFRNSSTAANASMFAGAGQRHRFFDSSTAGNASIGGLFGSIVFNDASKAGSARIDVIRSSVGFSGSSSAENAVISVSGGSLSFSDSSTAANATLTTSAAAPLTFLGSSTAANATIDAGYLSSFGDNASAGNATIRVRNTLGFAGSSTAANATITVNNGASVSFSANSTGGQARFILDGGPLTTLSIAGLSTAGTSAGSIEGGGTIQLGSKTLTVGGNNLSTEFQGAIADGGSAGGLTKVGTGTLTLGGTSTYTGPTTVNAGALSVNGSIVSAVTVNSGGTLGGNGTVGSTTVNSGGTLSPGNSIGVLNINGNLVLGAGAIYLVDVSPTSADRTNVTGTATLGGTVHAIFGPGSYTSNRYTILSAMGGRSGTFDALTTSGLPATLSAHLGYTANDALLVTLTSNMAGILTGNTPNQKAVAGAQDTAFNTGRPVISALYNLPLSQLPGALDQLSGEVHVSTAGVLADESRTMRDAMLGRLRQASYGGDASMASLSVGGPMAAFANGELDSALAYGKSPIVTKAPIRVPQAQADVVFWAQGFGARGRFETDGNAATLRRDLAGFISGVDTRVGSNGRLGVAAGYTGSKNALDGRGTADVETAHIAGYGGWSFGAFNLRAGGAYAFHSINTDRLIAFPGFFDRTTANYDGHTGQIFGELGYGFAFGNVAIEPFAGAAWVRVKTDAAAERGGAAALNFAGTTFETGYTTLGIRAASMIPVGHDMMLVPRGTLAWQHAFDTVMPAGVLAFQAAPVPFTIAGVPIARDSLLAEAGLDLAIGRHATLGVSYVGQFAGNVQDHAGKGKFSWKF